MVCDFPSVFHFVSFCHVITCIFVAFYNEIVVGCSLVIINDKK